MCSCFPGVALTILPNLGGHAGAYFARKSIKTWYKDLKKPEWTPPNCAYGPILTSLYTGMGYASYLVFKEGGGLNGNLFSIFFILNIILKSVLALKCLKIQ